MSSVQSKMTRHAKEQEKVTRDKRKPLREAEEEIAPILDLKYKDASAGVFKKFKALMDIQDLMFEEMRETLKNDLKEVLELKSAISDMKDSKDSSSRKEGQTANGLASQKTELVGKREGETKIAAGIENLTFKSKEVDKMSCKLDRSKKYSSNRGKKLSQNESQNYKVVECVEEASRVRDDKCRNCNNYVEDPEKEKRMNREDEPVKEMGEEQKHENFRNEEKTAEAPEADRVVTDDGAVLTLAADCSAATLDVRKQWGDIFNLLRENGLEPRFLCEVKLAFKWDDEMKTFSDLQSFREFTSQKPFMKELLKNVLPQNDKTNGGQRIRGMQEKVGKTLGNRKHEAGGTAIDGLSFLFIKEVKVARPEVKTQEQEFSEWKEKEPPKLDEEGEVSETEEEEVSEVEEEEEGEEDSEVAEEEEGEGEESSGAEEEEGEETSGVEEENNSFCKEQDLTFQGLIMVDTEDRVREITNDGVEIILIDSIVDSESEEEKSSDLGRKVKTTSQIEGKEEALCEGKENACGYSVQDSEKKKLVKPPVVHKTQNEMEAAMLRSQGSGTCCLTLHLTSPSKSQEMSSEEHKMHSCLNWSDSSGVVEFLRKAEKEELTSREADLLQETEENFRRSVISIFREMQEEIGNIKKSLPDVLEIKNSIDDLGSRMDILEERLNSLDDQMEEVSKDTIQMAKQIINKERLRDREDRFRSANIRLIGIPEKDSKENGAEDIVREIMQENFPELPDSSLGIVSAYRIPSVIDEHRLTPRHILVKFFNSNDKEKIIKASRERKEITYRGIRIRLTADLSLGTLDARSKWSNIIKVLQEEGFQPRILYPAKLAFDFEGKTKIFCDIEEFRKFISYVPYLKDLMENVL